MKSKSIYSEIWRDTQFAEASSELKLLIIYIFTHPNISLIKSYRLPSREIMFDLSLSKKEVDLLKKELEAFKIYFEGDYVVIKNKYIALNYKGSKLSKAKEAQMAELPENVVQMVKSDRVSVETDRVSEKSDTSNSNSNSSSNSSSKKNFEKKFNQFWEKYPRKVSKKKAMQTYLAILKENENLHQKIMEGLEKHIPLWKKTEAKFIPHPTTWLNGERWNDKVEKPGKKVKTDRWKFTGESGEQYKHIF